MPENQEAEVRRVLAGFAPVWRRVTGEAEPEPIAAPPPVTRRKRPHPPGRCPGLCPAVPIAVGFLLCAGAHTNTPRRGRI